MKTITFRWLVRQTAIRNPRFGETREDVLRWGVYPYIERPDGFRVFPDGDHPFSTHRSLEAAHAAARRECTRRYGDSPRALYSNGRQGHPSSTVQLALHALGYREGLSLARRGGAR